MALEAICLLAGVLAAGAFCMALAAHIRGRRGKLPAFLGRAFPACRRMAHDAATRSDGFRRHRPMLEAKFQQILVTAHA